MDNHGSKFLSLLKIFLLISVVCLAACPGRENNDDEGTANPAPTLNLAIQAADTFHFSWVDVAYETEYRLLEDPDGISGYSEVATIIADSTSYDLAVSLPDRINARYILQACDTGVCTDSNEVFVADYLASAVGYFKASNTEENDLFGMAIALSGDGNTLAVGAPYEDSGVIDDPDDNSAPNSGAVYIFIRTGTTWSQQAYLKASNAQSSDLFGTSIALSDDGNTLAVGAGGEDGDGVSGQVDNSAPSSGAVYIFSRSGDTWSPDFYVKASYPEEGDHFGDTLAFSGDGLTLAVGAPYEDSGVIDDPDDNSVSNSGAVYVFVNDASFWYQQAYLKAPIMDPDDHFGRSIDLSDDGDTLVVSAIEDSNGLNPSDNSAPRSGAVYLFTRSGFDWNTQVYLKASDPDEDDQFGFSVSLSGDGQTLAVGAPYEDSDGSDPDNNSAENSGAVYVFTGSGITWDQTSYLKASNIGEGDLFGWSIALSGDSLALAVGAYLEDGSAIGIGGDQSDNSAENSGAAYIFARVTDVFTVPYVYIKASNTEVDDRFGNKIAISSSGDTLAAGTYNEDSNAIGIGGDQSDNSAEDSGAVYLYSTP